MLVLHRSIEQVRTVGNSLSVQLICLRHTPVASLQGLSEALDEAGIDSPLSLQESGLLPQECRKRYEYIEQANKDSVYLLYLQPTHLVATWVTYIGCTVYVCH